MYERPEYLVWIEIAGILGLLALLLAPLLFLAMEMMGGGRGGGGVVAGGNSPAGPPPSAVRRGLRARSGPTPVPGLSPGNGTYTAPSEAHTPFSADWRTEATPNLLGSYDASRSGGTGPTGRAGSPGGASSGEVSTFKSRAKTPSGTPGSGTSRPSWVAEARRLGRQAQALSGQLRAMESGGQNAEGRTAEGPSAAQNKQAQASTAQNGSNPGTPDNPTVPIDDHVHWLLAAGVLWGAWRIARGA